MTRRRWAVLATVPVLVTVLAYGIPAMALAGEVPPKTTAGGVEIGGLSPESAEARLSRELAAEASRPMTLTAGGSKVRLTPQKLGLTLDARATVAAALSSSTTPAGVFRSVFGSRRLDLVTRVDERRLAAALAEVAKKVDRKPREGGIRYNGTKVLTTMPKAGQALEREGAASAVRQAFMNRRESVALPVTRVAPQVSAATVREVAGGIAATAVAGPLTLVNGQKRETLSPEQLAARLRFVPDGAGGLRPEFDASKVGGELVAKAQQPKNATFTVVSGKPRVVPSEPGKGVDVAALGSAVAAALVKGDRTVQVTLRETQPKLTTQKARKLGVKQKVSSYTTRHPCCAPRVTNIHRIADIVDGHVVLPGETFSLNGVVGRRDRARGFVEAPMILNNRFVNDVGGGVSQFATTMFNAVFFGGFQDVQHRPHQFYISRYPAGRESTVSFPQPDFRWRNDSPYGVLIKTSYTATSVTVQFWSTKRFDIESKSSQRYDVRTFPTLKESGPECIPMGGVEGFAIDVWRIFKRNGKTVKEQKFHTVYDPEPRLECTR